jgi:HD-GYP domain-containing protein (c-di-GMP phosphodiesterase class II)
MTMNHDSPSAITLRRFKWLILCLSGVCITGLEAYYYFIRGVPLLDDVIDWLIGLAIAVVLIEISFRYVARLQGRLHKEIIHLRRLEKRFKESGDTFHQVAEHIEEWMRGMDHEGEGLGLGNSGIMNNSGTGGSDTLREARVYYRKLLALAKEVETWVGNDEPVNIDLVTRHLRALIECELIELLYYCLVFEGNNEGGLAEHSVDVTILSLMVGRAMDYDIKRLLPLAVVAFLHDVGMYKVPEDILDKKGKLTEREFKAVKRHPLRSAEILSGLGEKYEWLSELSLQIHERADGSGYPQGLRGDTIHEFAYVVGLVDMYSAMIKSRPYRDRIEKNKVMKTIISCKAKFSIKVLKAFLKQISFFPLGSQVKLNDRSVGRVITTNPDFPLKPTVEILYDHLGNKLAKPRIVDLSKEPLLYIRKSVDEGLFE